MEEEPPPRAEVDEPPPLPCVPRLALPFVVPALPPARALLAPRALPAEEDGCPRDDDDEDDGIAAALLLATPVGAGGSS